MKRRRWQHSWILGLILLGWGLPAKAQIIPSNPPARPSTPTCAFDDKSRLGYTMYYFRRRVYYILQLLDALTNRGSRPHEREADDLRNEFCNLLQEAEAQRKDFPPKSLWKMSLLWLDSDSVDIAAKSLVYSSSPWSLDLGIQGERIRPQGQKSEDAVGAFLRYDVSESRYRLRKAMTELTASYPDIACYKSTLKSTRDDEIDALIARFFEEYLKYIAHLTRAQEAFLSNVYAFRTSLTAGYWDYGRFGKVNDIGFSVGRLYRLKKSGPAPGVIPSLSLQSVRFHPSDDGSTARWTLATAWQNRTPYGIGEAFQSSGSFRNAYNPAPWSLQIGAEYIPTNDADGSETWDIFLRYRPHADREAVEADSEEYTKASSSYTEYYVSIGRTQGSQDFISLGVRWYLIGSRY